MIRRLHEKLLALGIAALCFGYFAAYIPYSMLTKMITKGLLDGQQGQGATGFEIQPVVVTGTFLAMYLFLTLSDWWKYATHSSFLGIRFPRPQWFTFVSGLCTSGIIITTTLAYTFKGISIVFAMLLMRGGVLAMAPIVDLLAHKRRRKIYWPSWMAAGLSFGALFISFSSDSGMAMTVVAVVDVALYLTSYFLRLFFMSNCAKSASLDEKKRYFTEEQMVANPALFAAVILTGLVGQGMAPDSIPGQIWHGIITFQYGPYLWHAFFIGVFSYGTGLFGSLIFLDRRENTFTVPANRVSSVLSGVVATYLLAIFYGQRYPDRHELIGTTLIIASIVFLAYRSTVEKQQQVVRAPMGRRATATLQVPAVEAMPAGRQAGRIA